MNKISHPLTNVQLEMLKLFSYNLDHKELQELKDVIAAYFAKKTVTLANQVWEEKGWTDDDVDRMLNTKMRKSK